MRRCRGLVILLLLVLSACTSLRRNDFPVSGSGCPFSVPGYELQATLRVHNAGQREVFFVAMRTAADSGDLALLTLQGIPVYSIDCAGSEPEVSRQVRVASAVYPQLLLQYLSVMLLPEEELRLRLQPGWLLAEREAQRLLSTPAAAGVIRVSYVGKLPQFTSIKLEDTGQGMTVVLEMVGASRALLE